MLEILMKKKEDRAITYIAEVCKNFDIIAIQEVKDALGGIEKTAKEFGQKVPILVFGSFWKWREARVCI